MTYTFLDSGKTVEIEGISFLTITLIRGWYEQNFPNKPNVPMIALGDIVEPNYKDPKYIEDLASWSTKMRQAQWAAIKSYYASCIKDESVDKEVVVKAIQGVATIFNLPQAIVDGYTELQVPFDLNLLDKYIYLFHVCITNSSEQTLFEDAIMLGSSATQEVVAQTMFRYRTKV